MCFEEHMPIQNKLTAAPPHAVETTLSRLGANLRLARLQRNLTIGEVAEKIGTGPRAVRGAEKGNPTTGIVVYTALLWAYGLIEQLESVAAPENDEEGLALSHRGVRERARSNKGLDNDF